MPTHAKPTSDYVRRLRDQLLGVWQVAHRNWEEADRYHNLTFTVWDTEAQRLQRGVVYPTTARNIVDHAVDSQLSFHIKSHKYPAGEGEGHKEKADRIEPFLDSVIQQAALRESGITTKQLAKNFVLYGYAVSYGPVLDLGGKPEEPEREEGEEEEDLARRQRLYKTEQKMWLPIRWQAPHPSRVLLDPLVKQPVEAILLDTRFAGDLEALTAKKKRQGRVDNIWVRSAKVDQYEPIPTVEYWNPEWHFMIDEGGQIVFLEKNTWRFVSFSHGFGGWGQERTDEDIKGAKPEYLAQGILAPVLPRLKQEAQLVSAMHQMVMRGAYARRGTAKDAEEARRALDGGVITGSRKDDWWFEDYPKVTADMFQALADCQRDIEQGTFARTLGGERAEGVTTVGQQYMLSDAAQKRFLTVQEQLGQMLTIFCSNVLRLVDALGETLTVQGFSVSPQDIEDYAVSVEMKQVNLVMQLQVEQNAQARVAAGLLSKETYWKETGIEDASGERERIFEDLVWSDPEVVGLAKDEIKRGRGLSRVLATLRAAKERQAASPAPTEGGPLAELTEPLPERIARAMPNGR